MNWFTGLFGRSSPKEAPAIANEAPPLVPESAADTGVEAHRRGNVALGAGDLAGAIAEYRSALAASDTNAGFHLSLGFALFEQGQNDEASLELARAIALDPHMADAPYFLGRIALREGDIPLAERNMRLAVTLRPRFSQALDELMALLAARGAVDTAEQVLRQSIAADPAWALARFHLATIHVAAGNTTSAVAEFDRVLDIDPDFVPALERLAGLLVAARRGSDALVASRRLVRLSSESALAHSLEARSHWLLGSRESALAAARRATVLDASLSDAWYLIGILLSEQSKDEEAVSAFARALADAPDLADARLKMAACLARLGRFDEATAELRIVVKEKPDLPHVWGYLALAEWSSFDWTKEAEIRNEIVDRVGAGKAASSPFNFLLVSDSAQAQRKCATLTEVERFDALARKGYPEHARIRVAYLSPDFRHHAVSFLTAGVIEAHDRDKFEVTAISWGDFPDDPTRSRMKKAFDHFIDVTRMSDTEVAQKMLELEIDIAVDLAGFTRDARPGILARRGAPVQVNFLGYPGTMGVSYMDYIIADRYVIPANQQASYSEAPVYMPVCYQSNDSKRNRPEATLHRRDFGLPDAGFVFCSLHSTPKVNPRMFDIWMRLLHAVEGSVLWILCNSARAEENLFREAKARGIAADRLVVARDIDYDAHIARHTLADLYLDTLPFNAGTSASDALWAGLPVLTSSGEAFAARMAGSLLSSLGLPELIAPDLEQYEATAIRLAHNPKEMSAIRERLVANRATSGLFSSERFCSDLERGYTIMRQRSIENAKANSIEL